MPTQGHLRRMDGSDQKIRSRLQSKFLRQIEFRLRTLDKAQKRTLVQQGLGERASHEIFKLLSKAALIVIAL